MVNNLQIICYSFIIILNFLLIDCVLVKREHHIIQHDNAKLDFEELSHNNPLLAAYIFSKEFDINRKQQESYNHPDHLPLNPYLVLLLSHYGKYLGNYNNHLKGLYGYNAANNYHNNQPFGSYKVYEDSDQ